MFRLPHSPQRNAVWLSCDLAGWWYVAGGENGAAIAEVHIWQAEQALKRTYERGWY